MKTRLLGVNTLRLYAVCYLVFLYLPVAFIPLFSINDSIYVSFPLNGVTLRWYAELFRNSALVSALLTSLEIAFSVAILSTVLGTLSARAFTRYRIAYGPAYKQFILLPLFVPMIILGVALLMLLHEIGLPLSKLTVGIGHVVMCVPVSMMIMTSRLENFDRSLEEAAQDLGENRWMTFWRVTFPLALPGVVASLLLTFTISFDEFLLAFFLVGDDATLPIYIWSQLRFPQRLPMVLALGTCILATSALIIVTAEVAFRRNYPPRI